jgi:hypothetical protein
MGFLKFEHFITFTLNHKPSSPEDKANNQRVEFVNFKHSQNEI